MRLSSGNEPGAFRAEPPSKSSSLHVRYDAGHFPEDLVFQETADPSNFQGRYILRHPYSGEVTCDALQYRQELRRRQEQESKNLASLTGWRLDAIHKKTGLGSEPSDDRKWYEKLWGR